MCDDDVPQGGSIECHVFTTALFDHKMSSVGVSKVIHS